MMRSTPWWFLCILAGCTHVRPDDMSERDHRLVAATQERAAADHARQYDPKAVTADPLVGSQTAEAPGPTQDTYSNPTSVQLMRAQAHLRLAHAHTAAANQLEHFEDEACAEESAAQRAACPLVTGSVDRVQELPDGLRLHLKPGVEGAALARRMRCHQAFARTLAFAELPSCPLYSRGLSIGLVAAGTAIEMRAQGASGAAELKAQAKVLFGSELP